MNLISRQVVPLTDSRHVPYSASKSSIHQRKKHMADNSDSPAPPNQWSAKVTRESTALSLEKGVFTWKDPQRIAASLRDSAEASSRRKAEPFRSAMSMLVFYINRAGKNLDPEQRQILEQAKQALRELYGKG